MLDDRKAAILGALVDAFVDSGEPVSSATIARIADLGVSSATIRNELVKLEHDGYVVQPHTSAGRVPTAAAYRFYVQHLAGTARLRSAVRNRIERFFADAHLRDLFQEASDLLADLSHLPAVVVGPGLGSDVLKDVHLFQVSPKVVKVVLVTESGNVSQNLAPITRPVSHHEIDAAERLLAQAFVGRDVSEGVDAAEELQGGDRSADVRTLVKVAAGVAQRSKQSIRKLYYGGTSQLTNLWGNLAELHWLLEFLEAEDSVLELLDEPGEGTTVRIGDELPLGDAADLAVVTTTFETGYEGTGRVGVIGPMRMDYRRTIRLVEEVGEGLGESLGD